MDFTIRNVVKMKLKMGQISVVQDRIIGTVTLHAQFAGKNIRQAEGEVITDCTDCDNYRREDYPDDPGEFSDWCAIGPLPLDRKICKLFKKCP